MTFVEWAWKYGVDSACRNFRVGDVLTFTIKPGKYVFAQCGDWKMSYPLGMGASITEAKNQIRRGILNSHKQEICIIDFQQELTVA